MAAQIISEPNSLSYVYDRIEYNLRLTDLGSGTIEKKLGYKVFMIDADNVESEVTGMNAIKPFSANQNIKVDISADIAPLLSTSIPDFISLGNVPFIRHDKLCYCKAFIKVYEITFDTSTCDEAVVSLSETSEQITIVNSAPQNYEEVYTNESDKFVMDTRPKVFWLNKDASDYMWVYGSTSVRYTDNLGNIINASASNQVNMIPMVRLGANKETMKWMDVFLADVQGGITYRVHFKDCHNPLLVRPNVSYLSHLGGRVTVSFDNVETLDVQTTSTKFINKTFIQSDISAANSRSKTNSSGRTITNKITNKTIELSYNEELPIEQMEAFKTAVGYLVHHVGTNVTRYWIKAELINQDSIYKRETLEDKKVQLKLTEPINQIRNDA